MIEVSQKEAAPTRLSRAEKAYVRGLVALREKSYPDALRQLNGYLELSSVENPEIQLLTQSLTLLLAIRDEITIIERS